MSLVLVAVGHSCPSVQRVTSFLSEENSVKLKRRNFFTFAIAVFSILIHLLEEIKSKFRGEFFVFKNTELALAGVAQ